MNRWYVLDEHGEPRAEEMLVAARWFEAADRTLARDERDGVAVSTVFLGLDHQMMPDGPPLLWETMVFGGNEDSHQQRYETRVEAELGHAAVVSRVLGL